MLNRRFLRTKVFQALYSFYQDGKENIRTHEKLMYDAPEKAYQLYFFLLDFASEFRFYLQKEMDVQSAKHFPDKALIHQISILHKNKTLTKIEHIEELREQIKSNKIRWSDNADIFKAVFAEIRKSSFFTEYLNAPVHTFVEDRKLVLDIFEMMFCDMELFDQYVEERFINWEDDQLTSALSVIRSVKKLKENTKDNFIEKVSTKNGEDNLFMKELFELTVEKENEFVEFIKINAKNWETERIALVDLLLMKMAICEILCFPQIPVKVTINEYLELAKQYSTPNSHGFINGILDQIQIGLKSENKINKTGRGLVE